MYTAQNAVLLVVVGWPAFFHFGRTFHFNFKPIFDRKMSFMQALGADRVSQAFSLILDHAEIF
jgi:hypothetical protein